MTKLMASFSNKMPPKTEDSASRFCGGTLRRLSSMVAMNLCCVCDERTSADLPLKSGYKIQTNLHQEKQKATKKLARRKKFCSRFEDRNSKRGNVNELLYRSEEHTSELQS